MCAHIYVRLHTMEKWPCSVMIPAEAQLSEPGFPSGDRLANELWPPFQPGGRLSQQSLQIPSLGTWGTAMMCMWEDRSPALPSPHENCSIAVYTICRWGTIGLQRHEYDFSLRQFLTVKITFSQLVKFFHTCIPHLFTYAPLWNLFECCRDAETWGR